MNILWIKDGKIGHEKQVKALLDEICKTENIKIIEEEYKVSSWGRLDDVLGYYTNGAFGSGIDGYQYFKYRKMSLDIVIGAGTGVHTRILEVKKNLKKDFNKDVLSISVLVPGFFKKDFDIICAPLHDSYKLPVNDNVIYFEGSLANVYDDDIDEGVGLIGIGGKNKHYIFNENKLIQQIEYVTALYPDKKWHIFSSRRTPARMLKKLSLLSNSSSTISLEKEGFNEVIKKASIKVVTQDSINMVYESLSTKGKTFLFNMKYLRKNKVISQINQLLVNKQVGYLEYSKMVDGLVKIKMQPQNEHHEVFAEVEKLAYKLIQKIKI